MKRPRTYASAGSFRKAIAGTEKVDISRLRRQVAFDRLLARLFRDKSAPWVLKGGHALELELKVARATVDIDLALPGTREFSSDTTDADPTVRDMLQAAAGVDLGDWFAYTIGAPIKDLDAAPYGGARCISFSPLLRLLGSPLLGSLLRCFFGACLCSGEKFTHGS